LPIGYSDHTNGITVAIAAVAKGAVMIEKHFTLGPQRRGPDHKTSITPREFKAMRMAIVEVEACLGDGKKRVLECERQLHAAWRGN
jgi:N,N'-diacetyllegionaminate synthase